MAEKHPPLALAEGKHTSIQRSTETSVCEVLKNVVRARHIEVDLKKLHADRQYRNGFIGHSTDTIKNVKKTLPYISHRGALKVSENSVTVVSMAASTSHTIRTFHPMPSSAAASHVKVIGSYPAGTNKLLHLVEATGIVERTAESEKKSVSIKIGQVTDTRQQSRPRLIKVITDGSGKGTVQTGIVATTVAKRSNEERYVTVKRRNSADLASSYATENYLKPTKISITGMTRCTAGASTITHSVPPVIKMPKVQYLHVTTEGPTRTIAVAQGVDGPPKIISVRDHTSQSKVSSASSTVTKFTVSHIQLPFKGKSAVSPTRQSVVSVSTIVKPLTSAVENELASTSYHSYDAKIHNYSKNLEPPQRDHISYDGRNLRDVRDNHTFAWQKDYFDSLAAGPQSYMLPSPDGPVYYEGQPPLHFCSQCGKLESQCRCLDCGETINMSDQEESSTEGPNSAKAESQGVTQKPALGRPKGRPRTCPDSQLTTHMMASAGLPVSTYQHQAAAPAGQLRVPTMASRKMMPPTVSGVTHERGGDKFAYPDSVPVAQPATIKGKRKRSRSDTPAVATRKQPRRKSADKPALAPEPDLDQESMYGDIQGRPRSRGRPSKASAVTTTPTTSRSASNRKAASTANYNMDKTSTSRQQQISQPYCNTRYGLRSAARRKNTPDNDQDDDSPVQLNQPKQLEFDFGFGFDCNSARPSCHLFETSTSDSSSDEEEEIDIQEELIKQEEYEREQIDIQLKLEDLEEDKLDFRQMSREMFAARRERHRRFALAAQHTKAKELRAIEEFYAYQDPDPPPPLSKALLDIKNQARIPNISFQDLKGTQKRKARQYQIFYLSPEFNQPYFPEAKKSDNATTGSKKRKKSGKKPEKRPCKEDRLLAALGVQATSEQDAPQEAAQGKQDVSGEQPARDQQDVSGEQVAQVKHENEENLDPTLPTEKSSAVEKDENRNTFADAPIDEVC